MTPPGIEVEKLVQRNNTKSSRCYEEVQLFKAYQTALTCLIISLRIRLPLIAQNP